MEQFLRSLRAQKEVEADGANEVNDAEYNAHHRLPVVGLLERAHRVSAV